ncbi:MAG TPA: DUF5695 domain-containing protein [Fimbriimonas sp.]|nr:DUF5695 domain-containing protein [Fimbriimonas sp.]
MTYRDGEITSLKCANDKFPTEYIAPGAALGSVHLTYRRGSEPWKSDDPTDGIAVSSHFEPVGNRLIWHIDVKNTAQAPIEIGDLATPLPMNGRYARGTGMTNSVLKHSFISGDGSFLFWMRPNAIGPFLMMTPLRGTTPEYWDAIGGKYQVYIHSKTAGEIAKSKGTQWRIPETSLKLAPGQSASYGYALQWAKDYDDVRDILAKDGQLDVQVIPGMTVPTDLEAQIALRSSQSIQGLDAEFPAKTQIQRKSRHGQTAIYKIKFAELGENRLTVRYGNGLKTCLEFFCTEPIETLIKKRGAFLAKCRHTDPTKWYNGLISDWNMETGVLLGPDNYDRITGWRIYEVSCDDPGLGKPAFLAAKNAEYPVQGEVTALDDYIEHFVWGGLQQTTSEPYPYGIYGIPDWKTLRESKKKPHDGVEHIWRVYDYPHVVLLYESMYRMAVRHPEIHTRLKPIEYLRRAYGTAEAMYTVPAKVDGWSAYETGFYNEMALLNVISDLEANGLKAEANTLRDHWEKKVKNFVLGRPDLFGSEYAFDSTGFESTGALGRYAMEHCKELGISTDAAKRFLDNQVALNIFCRGSIEPAYYYLGSDYRGGAGNGYTLSYMSQMGGWSVLDYGLHYAADPASYIRLGYASYLSSWALMNTGTAESNYGYWYPGKANDGGTGGGFEPAAYGKTWLDQPHHRGSWYYGCEIDLGYCGALRTAATTVTDDPIFGRICLGGTGSQLGNKYVFVPRDGLRRRLYLRLKSLNADILLDGARFASGKPVRIDEKRGEVEMPVTNDSSVSAKIVVKDMGKDHYVVLLDGKPLASLSAHFSIPVGSGTRKLIVRRKVESIR